MKITHLAVVVASFTLAACASSNGLPTEPVVYSQAEAADSIRIRIGQTIVVEGVKVRFSAVESDSRCPIDAICVWQGDAVAVFVVEQNCDCRSPYFEFMFQSTLDPKSVTTYASNVEFRHIAAYPSASSSSKHYAYSAWIRLTPG